MAATQAFPASLPPHYAQEVCQQWERFVSGQLLDVETVRPVVRDSWLRCRETGLNPFHPPLAPAVSEEELESLRTAAVLPVHDLQSTRPIGYVLTFPFPQAPRTRPRVAPAPAGIPGDLKASTFDPLVGQAPTFLHAVAMARLAAQYDDPVLFLGESGTGKELLAQALHHTSARRQGPFVTVNRGGTSEDLVAAELFGYTAGAFTGARRDGKRGKLERAQGGTLFLDEGGNMPVKRQQALLRAIEERASTPLGAERPRPVVSAN